MRWKSILRAVAGGLGVLVTATVLWSQTPQLVAVRAGRLNGSIVFDV